MRECDIKAHSGSATGPGSAAARDLPATAIVESRRGGAASIWWGEISKSWSKYSGRRVYVSTISFGRLGEEPRVSRSSRIGLWVGVEYL
jgi:hypothetical protein